MNDLESEVAKILDDWSGLTVKAIQARMRRFKVGGKTPGSTLIDSVRYRMYAAASGRVGAEFSFNDSGRFIDMGVGRGYPTSGPTSDRVVYGGEKPLRYPKRVYARPFYARLNRLMETISVEVREQVIHEFNSIPPITISA